MILQYYGMLGSGHSWSTVSRNLLLEIQKQGVSVVCRSTNLPKGVPSELKVIPRTQSIETEVSLSYTIPPNLKAFKAKHKIVIVNNDSTALPTGWNHLLNKEAHLVLPSSQFAYDILKENGVHEQRMRIVPHGYHPEDYHPDIKPIGIGKAELDDKFKLLTVAAPHWRKGLDVLLEAYIEEFKEQDDVVLILKSTHNVHEAKAAFHVDFNKLISELKNKYKFKWPEIQLVTERVPSLAGLYKYADCTVLPSRAECFSLTMLESAMVKTPVITTDYGGHLDFLNHDNSYLIDYVMRKCPKEGQYHKFNPNAYVAEPSREDLKRLMRHVKNNPDEAKQKAELCYEQNKDLTWKNAATQILDLIKEKQWNV